MPEIITIGNGFGLCYLNTCCKIGVEITFSIKPYLFDYAKVLHSN